MIRLEGKPVMTVATILLSFSFMLTGIVEALPPKYAAAASSAVFIAGALGKALYALGTSGVQVPVDSPPDE